MKNKKEIGLDEWRLYDDLLHVLQMVKIHDLELYDVSEHATYTSCFAPVFQRHRVHSCFEKAQLVKTTGMLGYCFRCLAKPYRVVGLLCAVGVWYVLSHMVYGIEIKGSDPNCTKLIQDTLVQLGVTTPCYETTLQNIKQDLKKTLEHSIAWLEIEKIGSRYLISYTPKAFASVEELGHEELIAQQDGVIERFEVLHGNKLRKVNEFVHKGDVLVSNVIDTHDQTKTELFVKGRVFAYTWKDVSVTMEDDGMPKSMQYFDMLLQARSEISEQMKKDDRIYHENILQFSKELGKIKMVIHYTLIQDITTP